MTALFSEDDAMRPDNRFAFVATLVVAVCFAVAGHEARAEDDENQRVRMIVHAFERSLHEHAIEGEPPHLVPDLPAEQRAEVRAFFADLDSKALKLEALGMMYDRFVFVIPPDMVAELAGPYLNDPDDDLQIAAMRALTRYGVDLDEPLTARLLELSEDESASIRREVVRAMCRNGDAFFVPAIHRLMDDPDAQVRESAIYGWGNWLRANRRNGMLVRTSDPDPEVASAAIMHIAAFMDAGSGTDAASYLRVQYRTLHNEPDPAALQRFVAGMNLAVEREEVTQAFASAVMRR